MIKVFKTLKKLYKRRKRVGRIVKKTLEIQAMLRLRRVFRGWKKVYKGQIANMNMIGARPGEQHFFCIKYSDFCQCRKCNAIRSRLDFKLERVRSKSPVLVEEPLVKSKFVEHQRLPFSQLYADGSKSSINFKPSFPHPSGDILTD